MQMSFAFTQRDLITGHAQSESGAGLMRFQQGEGELREPRFCWQLRQGVPVQPLLRLQALPELFHRRSLAGC